MDFYTLLNEKMASYRSQ